MATSDHRRQRPRQSWLGPVPRECWPQLHGQQTRLGSTHTGLDSLPADRGQPSLNRTEQTAAAPRTTTTTNAPASAAHQDLHQHLPTTPTMVTTPRHHPHDRQPPKDAGHPRLPSTHPQQRPETHPPRQADPRHEQTPQPESHRSLSPAQSLQTTAAPAQQPQAEQSSEPSQHRHDRSTPREPARRHANAARRDPPELPGPDWPTHSPTAHALCSQRDPRRQRLHDLSSGSRHASAPRQTGDKFAYANLMTGWRGGCMRVLGGDV